MTESGRWGWRTDARAVFVDGTTYAGFVDEAGNVTVAAIRADGRKNTYILAPAFDTSRSVTPVLAPLPDGRVLVFYAHELGTEITVREMTTGGKGLIFSPAQSIRVAPPWDWNDDGWRGASPPRFTYGDPSVALLKEVGRGVLVWRRGPWGDPQISFSDDLGHDWTVGRSLFIPAPRGWPRRPSVKLVTDGKKRIHFFVTDTRPEASSANSLYYFYSEGDGFYRASGERIGGLEDLPLRFDNVDVVYDGVAEESPADLLDIAVTAHGTPVIAYVQFDGEAGAQYRYAVWNGFRWRSRPITSACQAGEHNGDEEGSRTPYEVSGIALDRAHPQIAYVGVRSGDNCVIERWFTPDHGDTWSSMRITDESRDAWRPVSARGASDELATLLWLTRHGDHGSSFSVRAARLDRTPYSASLAPSEILQTIRAVADWQLRVPIRGSPTGGFSTGPLFTGLLALSRLPGGEPYKARVLSMCAAAGWRLGGEGDPRRRYNPLNHAFGQAYLELYDEYRRPEMLADSRALGDEMLPMQFDEPLAPDDGIDDPVWAFEDALFMTPTLLARLAAVTDERRYLDLADRLWWKTTDYLLDRREQLFYRDGRYFVAPRADRFWSRGNGWVLAGLARVYPYLPADFPTRGRYERLFQSMAARIAGLQQDDGFWRSSLLAPGAYSMPETSGTGFFVFALAWGINEGLLDAAEYLPVVRAGWAALVSAVDVNGKLGWSQPHGIQPGESQVGGSDPYTVGAFLLAGVELFRLASSGRSLPQE